MTRREIVLLIIIVLLLGGGAYWITTQANKINDLEEVSDTASDSLETYRNQNGELVAEIKSFDLSNEKELLALKTQDKAIQRLQEVVKGFEGKLAAAIIASGETSDKGATATEISGGDTVKSGDTVFIYPIYSTEWAEKWSEGIIKASRDSITRDIKIKNDYSFTLGKKSNGWFKKREVVVEMTNLNPNTVTKELRSYNVRQEPKRLNLVVYGGAGYQFGVGIVPQIGLGLGYTLISIK
jgi:hypothetical protein